MKLAPELALPRGARACLAAALVLVATTHAQSAALAPGQTTGVATSSFEDEFLLDPVFVGGRGPSALDAALDELGPASLARAVLGPPSGAQAAWFAAQEPPPAQEAKRWSSFLPLLKEEALARGYELPLPFGAGLTTTILVGRDIQVTDLRVGVNGAPLTSSRSVDLGSESDVFNANLKLDAWLLPFLNVYTLLGYVYNESQTDVHVTLPGPGATEFDLDVESELEGFVGGGGLTLAGGYGDFFLVVDSNWTQTDIGFDDEFVAITASMRAGYLADVGGRPVQTWLGGAYWDTENTAKGHADVPGVGRVDFEADQGPVYPWVIDLGANARIAPWFELALDVATDLHGGLIATVAPVFRF